MNYELAKQLKDAGFPLRVAGPNEIRQNGYFLYEVEHYYFPTLEEAIEACGDNFRCLWKNGNEWIAWAKPPGAPGYSVSDGHAGTALSKADSSLAAVAKLWLALNQK